MGGPEAQWKAQYLIFQKLREEGFSTGGEDIRLTVEILVPSAQVRVLYILNFGILIEAKIPGWPNYWQGRHQCPRDAENYRGCDKTSRAGGEKRYKLRLWDITLSIQFIFSGNIHWGGDKCAHSRFFLLYSGDILRSNLIRGNVSIMFSLPRDVSGRWYSTPPQCPASLCFLTEALDPRLVRPRSSLWPRPEKQEYFCSKNTSSPEITSSSVQYNEIQPPINLSPMPIQPNWKLPMQMDFLLDVNIKCQKSFIVVLAQFPKMKDWNQHPTSWN